MKWQTIDERSDPSVPKQSDPLACVAATGEMLLKTHGVDVSQAQILAKIGSLADPRDLAPMMNEVDIKSGNSWQGLIVEPDATAFDFLNERGAWGTVFREGSPIGHFVMVTGVDADGLINIKDPYPLTPDDESGTSYKMERDEFMRVWSGEVVFKWK